MRETINEMRYVDHHSMKESKKLLRSYSLPTHQAVSLASNREAAHSSRLTFAWYGRTSEHGGSLLLTFIAPGIPQNDSPSAAPEAVSQLTNGCAAQGWGQMCRFQGKMCPHFRSFTKSFYLCMSREARAMKQGGNDIKMLLCAANPQSSV